MIARITSPRAAGLFLVVTLACTAACGDDGGGSDGDDGASVDQTGSFLAFDADFAGWRGWEAFHLPDAPSDGVVHLAGPRTEYLNARPPKGSHEFPVGTIIVKELETGAMQDRKVFAMVKRGGGYDAAAAPGWEWFELSNNPDGSFKRIVWRGLGPPAGEQYGGDPSGCSGCHSASKDNDYVSPTALRLSDL